MGVQQILLCVPLCLRLCVSSVIASQVDLQSANSGSAVRLEKKLDVPSVDNIKLDNGNSSLLSFLKPRENATYKLWGKEYFGTGFDTVGLKNVNSSALRKLLKMSSNRPQQSISDSFKKKVDSEHEPDNSYDSAKHESQPILLKKKRENTINANYNQIEEDSEKKEYSQLIKNFTRALISSLKRAPKPSDEKDEEDEIITTTDTEMTEIPGTEVPEFWEAYQGSTVPVHLLKQPTESLDSAEDFNSAGYDTDESTTEEISTLAANSDEQYSDECSERPERINLQEKIAPAEGVSSCAKGLVAYVEKLLAPWWKGGFYGKGRGRRKKAMKRLLMPLLAVALSLKTFVALAVGAVAAVAGKSALVSFAALAVAGAVALLGGHGLRGSTAYGLHRLDTAPEGSAGPQHITQAAPIYLH